jgi:hypothetical protein
MKFDIARKVVKFENGQFGIRRLTWFGYQFLDVSRGEDFWWTLPDGIGSYATAGTEKEARERLHAYLQPEKAPIRTPGIDKGTPV